MKKLIKNKFFILTISVIILIVVYLFTQKAIDNYVFNTDSDIITEESVKDNEEGENGNLVSKESSEQFSSEETDLMVEEIDMSENDRDIEGESKDKEVNKVNGETTCEERKIYVYITGEVNNPGVVILNEGSRIVDAINAAGGTTSKADVTRVNLVFVLEDGMKVNIPNNSDLKNNPDFEYITMNSGDGRNDVYSNNHTSSNGASTDSNSSKNDKDYGIVNINTATQTELETLPGIGPSLALKIINYRKENGKFSSIDEIKNVSGIGDSKFEDLKQYITV